jgi:SAM-dependent methyltransferase
MADRFTPEGYASFYGDGSYRSLANSYNGIKSEIPDMQAEQRGYALRVVRALEGHISPRNSGHLLDIGGSTGVIAGQVAKRFGLTPTVLDPSEDEIQAARASGLRGIVGSIETFHNTEQFDIILLCQSIEHLSDLRGSLKKIHSLLRSGGLFFCDVVDYLASCRRDGAPQVVSKIDHCYWLCQETAPPIFAHMGFEAVATDVSTDPKTVGYVLRRGEPRPLAPMAAAWITDVARRFRELDADWRASEKHPNRSTDKLRLMAYRLKRELSVHRRAEIPAGGRDGATAVRPRSELTKTPGGPSGAGVNRSQKP